MIFRDLGDRELKLESFEGYPSFSDSYNDLFSFEDNDKLKILVYVGDTEFDGNYSNAFLTARRILRNDGLRDEVDIFLSSRFDSDDAQYADVVIYDSGPDNFVESVQGYESDERFLLSGEDLRISKSKDLFGKLEKFSERSKVKVLEAMC